VDGDPLVDGHPLVKHVLRQQLLDGRVEDPPLLALLVHVEVFEAVRMDLVGGVSCEWKK